MNHAEFDAQISRLKDQWPNSYNDERLLVLWNAFQSTDQIQFCEAVSECLANHRAAPLVKEIGIEVEKARNRAASLREYDGFKIASGSGILDKAARNNKIADPEFVKACMKLLRDKLDRKITYAQFLEGCSLLDQAAHLGSINPPTKTTGRDKATGEKDDVT